MNNYNEWINSKYISKEDKEILNNMTKEEIEESFNEKLEFGTAGIRGKMGLGSSKLNKYTIGKVTVGLANYLNKNFKDPKVVIAYDTRNNSKDFAIQTALILNYYGIETYIFDEETSTPELSFSVKYLNCTSGIVITSSHNSSIYNGYKVYNASGGQINQNEANLILREINDITSYEVIKKAYENNKLFKYVPNDEHKEFLKENLKVVINKDMIDRFNQNVRITYSSMHGVGLKTTLELFKILGYENYSIVEEQSIKDGNFPTCENPNPELIENYELAIKNAKEFDSDIILLSDPDADRLGVMYRKDNNEYELINGDFLGVLFFYYIINNKKIKNNSYTIRSIVTSPLIDEIAKENNIKVYEVLTGCKNIANKKNNLKDNYVFGYEESLGYMFDINVNDKNSFSSIVCMLEIMCYLEENNITLEKYIENIYSKYGYLLKGSMSLEFNDINYKEKINTIMNNFRNKKYDFDIKYDIKDYLNDKENTTNALKYIFEDKSTIMIRPSGTEPKIKFYITSTSNNYKNSIDHIDSLKDKINNIIREESR